MIIYEAVEEYEDPDDGYCRSSGGFYVFYQRALQETEKRQQQKVERLSKFLEKIGATQHTFTNHWKVKRIEVNEELG